MMRILLSGCLLFLSGLCLVHAQTASSQPGPVTRVYALQNVTIVTQPGQQIEGGTIVVRDGLIEAVGTNVTVPVDAKVIEVDSMFVYAGFIDGLSHTGVERPKEEDNGNRSRDYTPGNPPNDVAGITPQRSAMSVVKPAEKSIKDWREVGFTTAHIVPYQGMLPGNGAIIQLAGDSPDEMLIRSEAALFAQFEGARGRAYPSTVMAVMSKFREMYKQAEYAQQHQVAYQKAPAGKPRPTYPKEVKAMLPAVNQTQPVFFYVENAKDVYRAIDLESELGFSMILGGAGEAWAAIDAITERKIPVFLTLELPDQPKEKKKEDDEEMSEEMKQLEERRAAEMKKYETMAAELAKAGVAFGFSGMDAKPKDVRASLRRMIENGLAEEQALAALTTAPAELLGLSATHGTVAQGKLANLVITDGPYFEEKSAVRYVFVDGEIFEYEAKKPKKKSGDSTAEPANIAGTWSYTVEVPGQTVRGTMTFTGSDGDYEGVMQMEGASDGRAVNDIVVDGNTVYFTSEFDGGGQSLNLEFDLEVDGNYIEGTVTAGPMGTFDVEGTRDSDPN